MTTLFPDSFSLVELTHPLSPTIPTWNGSCGFHMEVKKDYDRVFKVQKMYLHAGCGTHMDAPSHRFQGAASIHDIPLDQFIAPCCIIDVFQKADADYEISVDDVKEYETRYGAIPPKSLIIGYTGWSRFWNEPEKYRNVDSVGQMHFPAFSKEAAALLMTKGIVGIAIDTLSPDCLDTSYPVHQQVLGAGKYIIENVANCSKMPPNGAFVGAFPIFAEEATEAPIRLVGFLPK